ncbi:hypothetical protein [Sporosarcina luteola]|uniref:hypothetical protein n=1 Tax=Sporosarcina luteola TaxID=582850 RepID=UPI00203D511D|nr:hypothetical protein [Sporosarcina luteola]MCM3709850.1 hypothetical protein [Sporosarcina luteola]
METFGRGCFYIIVGVVVLTLMSVMLQSQIDIPWIIAIPLIGLAFWGASKKTKGKDNK